MSISTNWFVPKNTENNNTTPSQVKLMFTLSELQELLGEIATLRKMVHSIPNLFNRSGMVKPIECDHLMDALLQTKTIMEKVIVLIRRPEKTSVALGSYNYQLLMRLHFSVDKISTSLEVAEQFRSICFQEDSESMRTLLKLHGELSNLLHENEKIEDQIESELDTLLLTANR